MARTSLKQQGFPTLLPLGDSRRSLVWEASVARSLLSDDELLQVVHNGGSSSTKLWWGPTVPVRDGDLVYYFKTASGKIAVEAIHGPDGLPTLNTIQ